MTTNTKRNEHPRCSCRQCKRGARTSFGQWTHRYINRKIRHLTRIALRRFLLGADFEPVVLGTPYTD